MSGTGIERNRRNSSSDCVCVYYVTFEKGFVCAACASVPFKANIREHRLASGGFDVPGWQGWREDGEREGARGGGGVGVSAGCRRMRRMQCIRRHKPSTCMVGVYCCTPARTLEHMQHSPRLSILYHLSPPIFTLPPSLSLVPRTFVNMATDKACLRPDLALGVLLLKPQQRS